MEIKVSTTLNCAKLINLKHNESLGLESVRVHKVSVLSVPRLIARSILLHVGNADTKL